MVVDDVNSSLTERELSTRELLIRLDERMANLSVKMDELRLDNSNKYEFLRDELKCSNERLQKDIDSVVAQCRQKFEEIDNSIDALQSMTWMQKGACIFIGFLISAISAVGAFIFYFIQ